MKLKSLKIWSKIKLARNNIGDGLAVESTPAGVLAGLKVQTFGKKVKWIKKR